MSVVVAHLWPVGRRGLPSSADVVMAVALVVVALADLWLLGLSDELSARPLTAAPFAIVVPSVLAWRRRRPLAAAGGAAAGVALQALLVAATTSTVQVATLLIVAFSLGAHAAGPRALVGWLLCVAAIVSVAAAASEPVGAMVSIPVFLAVPWVAGVAVRWARGYAERLEALTEQLERERERSSQLAVLEERGKLARELHDVVAHGVGVMTVQAAGARRIIDRDRDRARRALVAIESSGRAALVELERMLEVLRSVGEAAPTGPAPGIADLPALAARLRAAGLDVDLICEGRIPSASPALELAVYRIVQEALTNAVKHAPGAPVRAVVRSQARVIELEIVDAGTSGPRSIPPPAGGHGLIGMRERISLFGGTLEAGPRTEGGFRVYARIPVSEVA